MKITKEEDNLVVRIPMRQKIYNPYMEGEDLGTTDNLVGVIVNTKDDSGDFEQGFYQLNDMDYKGKPSQLGMPLVMTMMEDDKFRKLCKKLGILVWEYDSCEKCGETLWGTCTLGDKGYLCFKCEDV